MIFQPIPPTPAFRRFWRLELMVIVFMLGGTLAGITLAKEGDTPVKETGARMAKTLVLFESAIAAAEPATPVLPPAPPPPPMPKLIGELPDPGGFSASRILVKDLTSGKLLYEKGAYEPWPIASISKLMAALVLLEKERDWTATAAVVPGEYIDTHMYAGDTYTLEELWQAALVGSSNKAIMTLAKTSDMPLEAFVERMNQKAMELGMSATHFDDPTGLSSNNVSTASDVSLLVHAALAAPKIHETLGQKELTLYSNERKKRHHMWNTNWLLLGWIPSQTVSVVGGKTGYIAASGYNFASEITNGAGQTLSVVVFGTSSNEARFTEARDAAAAVFAAYEL